MYSTITSPPVAPRAGIVVSIDRGGTFTDCIATNIPGKEDLVVKLLSVDPSNYDDAPTEGIRRILEIVKGENLSRGELIDTSDIGIIIHVLFIVHFTNLSASIKMGTTVATNALLERSADKCALVVSKGHADLLRIGDQTRPKLFDLNIRRASPLFSEVVEIDERVTPEEYTEDPKPKSASELEALVDDVNVVKGIGGELIRIIKPLDVGEARKDLQALFDSGVKSLAVVLLHSYTFPDHELKIGQLAKEIGFTQISLSSQLLPMIKAISRGHSAAADAYLSPVVQKYINGFRSGFVGKLEDTTQGARCEFIQSDGGLVGWQRFNGLRAILSGPAGGVVGFSRTCYDEDNKTPCIGFDMGGTSTDVSRYGGLLTHTLENVIAGVTVQCPQLDITTVAAGGGSILTYRNGLFNAGPQSAGAHPGPACYRKGGPLTVTDANLVLGRLSADHFPKIFGPNENEPLDLETSRRAFEILTKTINTDLEKTGGKLLSVENVCLGFLDVANESMCRPIRQITESKGYNTADHNLASFGGAGGQHACAIADRLGIERVIVHKHASILSAYGMALADTVQEKHEPCSCEYASSVDEVQLRLSNLQEQVARELKSEGFTTRDITFERYVNLRYAGSDTMIMILEPEDGNYAAAFIKEHKREFSFTLDRKILVENLRIRGRANAGTETTKKQTISSEMLSLAPRIGSSDGTKSLKVYFQGGWSDAPLYLLKDCTPGDVISGPAMIYDQTQMIVVQPAAKAHVLSSHVVISLGSATAKSSTVVDEPLSEDPIQLSIMSNRFMGIAEQMGLTLQKTSVSVNIKERLDFSCALFGPCGGLVANAPHVPVHLGSMEHAVRYQHNLHSKDLRPGDVLVSNTPLAGGTHLPDITVITPIFDSEGENISFYTASRGHHSEIGGILPGSMPASSTKLYEEGAQITSMLLVSGGVFFEKEISKVLIDETGAHPGCSGTRRLSDNLNDLKAQIAANYKGATLVGSLIEECGIKKVHFYMNAIKKNAATAVKAYLKKTYEKFNGKPLHAIDHMDDGTPIELTITIGPEGTAKFDFTGTGLEGLHCFNAPSAITKSATMYVLRCLINEPIPLNEGCLLPITFHIPHGTILNPSGHAAVCAGNPITSQRVTDVLIKAFQACAASQGDCNVFSFGFGGKDPETGKEQNGFGFGETICGGSGAGKDWHGTSGVHIHMTNTRITDPEMLEKRYPTILNRFILRPASGGVGKYNGGMGILREYEFRRPLSCSIVSERRVYQPFGMAGGESGQSGKNTLVEKMSSGEDRWVNVGGRRDFRVQAGDRFIIETPGGGGYGTPGEEMIAITRTETEKEFTNSYQMRQDQSN
ncbi:Hydantoinase B/oxoprolinase-domain-containing protein [Calycina marina]|uniref:Hydantoinase B/oxoprolinase-domain-containing protein n=1 Tax=Calycina marina TaxID=1763456 RepID=A0A9P7Z062_9HELO|nr:Hydantoinase B/oxoprolinase-domain-containing protein [Calycina marina]